MTPLFFRDRSFRQRLESGATQEDLKKHYALTDSQYERVLKSLERIRETAAAGGGGL